jgi:hypothetical protein
VTQIAASLQHTLLPVQHSGSIWWPCVCMCACSTAGPWPHLVRDIHSSPCLQQLPHHIRVSTVGSKVQGSEALLHQHHQSEGAQDVRRVVATMAASSSAAAAAATAAASAVSAAAAAAAAAAVVVAAATAAAAAAAAEAAAAAVNGPIGNERACSLVTPNHTWPHPTSQPPLYT